MSANVAGRLRATSGELLRIAAIEGLGVTLAPRFIVDEDLADGQLQTVMTEFDLLKSGVFALYPSARHIPFKLRHFVEYLEDELWGATDPPCP